VNDLGPRPPRLCSLGVGLLAAALALGWQAATVRANYGGNWSALFCTSGLSPVPPELASERIYQFPNSTGYDGQFYHYVAHDPLSRRNLASYMDAGEWRYRRIFVPGLAHLLAGGNDRFVDRAYFAVVLLFVLLGGYWLSRYATLLGRHPLWGLCFLLVPATAISLDRMTVDVALAAFTAGFLLYTATGADRKLLPVLTAAVLVRETGALLAGSCCLHLLARRQFKRAVLFALTPLPALAWFWRLSRSGLPSGEEPIGGDYSFALLEMFTERTQYGQPAAIAWTATVLDYVAIAGGLAAAVMGLGLLLRRERGPAQFAAAMFGAGALALGHVPGWLDPFGFPRTLSPLLLLLATGVLRGANWWTALPLLLIVPRVLLQFGPQVLGVARALL